jgi:putative DNA methylase
LRLVVLARAKNTGVHGLVDAGILRSSRGAVRLLKPAELAPNWDTATDKRVSAWESVHQSIRALEAGDATAAELVAKLGTKAEVARELCYRLYTACERKKRAAEALSYNALVQSFTEFVRLAQHRGHAAIRRPCSSGRNERLFPGGSLWTVDGGYSRRRRLNAPNHGVE